MKESYYKITNSLQIILVLSLVCSVSFAQTDDREPHYSGYNCSNCHGFEFGGTVYTDAGGSSPVSGVEVQITGSNGNTATLTSNSYGNFWASSSLPVSPYTTTVSYNGNTIPMISSFSNGSCNGCHSNGSRIYIPPTQNPPAANFTGNPTSGDVPLTVNFTDQSSQGSGAITSWNWNFGDGGSSSNQNPPHTYSAVGTFSVTLTVTDANGLSDSFTRTNYITVNQSQFVTQTIPFATGWNWFSINVESDDMSLNTVLNSVVGYSEFIKSQTGFATYYAGFGWYGLDFIDVTSMYMIQITTSADLVFEGIPVDFQNTPISLSTGWNWIGYLPQLPNTLNEALYSIGDLGSLFKNQTGFATYYEGFGWYGGLEELSPGGGYMLKMINPAELIFGNP